jgi:hypothetical protein
MNIPSSPLFHDIFLTRRAGATRRTPIEEEERRHVVLVEEPLDLRTQADDDGVVRVTR